MHEAPPAPTRSRSESRSCSTGSIARPSRASQPYVIAGVAHYSITDIHPFADGNGRAARLFQAAILLSAGALPGRMFSSFERYYAEDRKAYYAALRSVAQADLPHGRVARVLPGGTRTRVRTGRTPPVADLSSLAASVRRRNPDTVSQSAGRDHGTAHPRQARVHPARLRSGLRRWPQRAPARTWSRWRATGSSAPGAPAPPAATRSPGRSTPSHPVPTAARRSRGRRAKSRPSSEASSPAAPAGRHLAEFEAAGLAPLYYAASRKGGIARWRTHVRPLSTCHSVACWG